MKMEDLRIFLLLIFLLSILFGLGGCLFDSPLELERQALHHAQKALDHANRLIPLLEVGSWDPAYKRAGKLKGELELSTNLLDRAMKRWALRGESPLRYETDSMEILNDVADNNQYIQDKLSLQIQGQGEITASVQNRLIDKAKENAKDLGRVVDKIGKAIDKHSAPEEEGS